MHRTPHLLLAVLLSLTLALSATAAPAIKTIRVALPANPTPLDPANHRSRITETVLRNIADGLFTETPDGKLIPEIAESLTRLDPATWDFKIRGGILFHNGDTLTADDVVFSYTRATQDGAMEGRTSPRKSLFVGVRAIQKLDDYKVRFHLATPVSETRMRYTAVFMQIMPRRYFEQTGPDGYARRPVGAGPFKFVEGDVRERIVLERFDRYWGGPPDLPGRPGPPPIDRVIFEFVPDSAARVAALRAGAVDIIQAVPPDVVPVLRADPGLNVATAKGSNMLFLSMNVTRPPFTDRRVRQAVAHAINYQLIVDKLYGGMATVLGGRPFMDDSEVSDPGLKPYAYSPARARALLREAGATGAGFVIDTASDNRDLAQAVAQMLEAVGLKADVRVWELAVLRSVAQKGERTAVLDGWGNASRNPMWAYWTSGVGQPANYSAFSNAAFDRLMDEAQGGPSQVVRTAKYRQGYAVVYNELPVLTLVVPQVIEASRRRVLNFSPHLNGRVNLHRVDLER
jgi:peptide/nickel transport system substrate-binding protein